MKEMHYYLADDGKKFDDYWECVAYERQKALEVYKNDFKFFNYRQEPIPFEGADAKSIE
jgi:hypothetical protein